MTDERENDDEQREDDPRRNDDYDGAWKSVLDALTEPFFALLFPAVHARVDWTVPRRFGSRECYMGHDFADRLMALPATAEAALSRGVRPRGRFL